MIDRTTIQFVPKDLPLKALTIFFFDIDTSINDRLLIPPPVLPQQARQGKARHDIVNHRCYW